MGIIEQLSVVTHGSLLFVSLATCQTVGVVPFVV